MKKRVSARAIIFENDEFYVFFRRRKDENGNIKEYFSIPGGGNEKDESLEETVIRELKEELDVDIKIDGYIGCNDFQNNIAHFFRCSIISGNPILSGEEKERNNENNYYEIRKISIKDIDKINIIAKDIIKKAYNKKYIDQ